VADLLNRRQRQGHRGPRRREGPAARGPARRDPRLAHGTVAKGHRDNQHKRSKLAKDGLRLARRFRDHQDMILQFATDLTVGFTSNQAERDIRPVKIQQRTSGGCWRTLDGLADFAIVHSYLSTTAEWGIDALDALTACSPTAPGYPPPPGPAE
jgi:transposase